MAFAVLSTEKSTDAISAKYSLHSYVREAAQLSAIFSQKRGKVLDHNEKAA